LHFAACPFARFLVQGVSAIVVTMHGNQPGMDHSADSATPRFYSRSHLKTCMELETQRSGDRRGEQAEAVIDTTSNNAQWAMGWIALMAIGSIGASGPAFAHLNPTRQRGNPRPNMTSAKNPCCCGGLVLCGDAATRGGEFGPAR